MTKIMRTLWDESAELTDEAMASDASVLSDSYTSGRRERRHGNH